MRSDQEIEPSKGLQDTIPTTRLVTVFKDWRSKPSFILSNNRVEDALDELTDLLGATEWEWYHGTNGIRFHF